MSMPTMDCLHGRFLLPTCKRRTNFEGLGSSMVFWRAAAAYALLLNLTLADEPLVVGHGIGTLAHTWLGLGLGACSGDTLRAAMDNGALRRVDHRDNVDFSVAGGGGALREAAHAVAAGRMPTAGTFEAKVLADLSHNTVFVLEGCHRLSNPLSSSLADQVESQLRDSYQRAAMHRQSLLPWAEAPEGEVQVALHFRAGDLFEGNWQDEELPAPLGKALFDEVHPGLPFDTWRGHRVLPVAYAVAALHATLAALPKGVRYKCWLFSEGPMGWFAQLRSAFPQLQLQLAPKNAAPEVAMRHLDALAHAHIYILGGGAFSELAASLNQAGLKLAPATVWDALSVHIPRALNLSYPGGQLTRDAAERIASTYPAAGSASDTSRSHGEL